MRQKMTRVKLQSAFTATSTTDTQTINENAFVNNIVITVPNFTNTVTTTVEIQDEEGSVLYTSGALNKNTTTTIGGITAAKAGEVPVASGYKCVVTLSGVAGGTGGTVTTKLFCKF